MYGGNPNGQNPYPPTQYAQSPQQPGYTNPFGFGTQRSLGQIARQPNAGGLGLGTNTTNPAANPYANQQQQNPALASWLQSKQNSTPFNAAAYGIQSHADTGSAPSWVNPANAPTQVSYQQYQAMSGAPQQQLGYSNFKDPMQYLNYQDQQGGSYFTGQSDLDKFQQTGRPVFSPPGYGY